MRAKHLIQCFVIVFVTYWICAPLHAEDVSNTSGSVAAEQSPAVRIDIKDFSEEELRKAVEHKREKVRLSNMRYAQYAVEAVDELLTRDGISVEEVEYLVEQARYHTFTMGFGMTIIHTLGSALGPSKSDEGTYPNKAAIDRFIDLLEEDFSGENCVLAADGLCRVLRVDKTEDYDVPYGHGRVVDIFCQCLAKPATTVLDERRRREAVEGLGDIGGYDVSRQTAIFALLAAQRSAVQSQSNSQVSSQDKERGWGSFGECDAIDRAIESIKNCNDTRKLHEDLKKAGLWDRRLHKWGQ